MLIPLLTYLLLFVTPLIVIPSLNLRFEPPKVLFAQILIEVLVVYAISTGKISLKRASKPLAAVLAGLFLLSFFHLIISPSQQDLFGNVFRLQGTMLFWHFLALALITQNYYFRLKEKYIYLSSFIAIIAGSLIFGSNRAGRWIGSLGEPNALGAVVILVFPFVFLSFKSVWVRAIGVIGAIWVINYTESKSALIALSLELLFLALVKLRAGKLLLASISCLTLLIISLSFPILERVYFNQTNSDPFNFRFEDRAEIWQVALTSGFDSPIFGAGIDSIQEKINTTAQRLNLNSQFQVIDSPHNILLEYWIWGGIGGLILMMILIFLTFKNLIQKELILEAVLLIGLLSVLMFNPLTVSVLAGFWWVIGRSFANSKAE